MKRKLLPLLSLVMLASSCASLLNSRHAGIHIATQKNSKIAVNGDTLTMGGAAYLPFVVRRDSVPVKIALLNDSIFKEINLKPILSRTAYLNVLNIGLGYYWKDKDNVKRFMYPKRIWIDATDTSTRYELYTASPKGRFSINASALLYNQFYVNLGNGQNRAGDGTPGLSISGNYWYKNKRFISLSAGCGFNTLPLPIDHFGDSIQHENYATYFIALKNNYNLARWDIGYGIAYSHLSRVGYTQTYINDNPIKLNDEHYKSFGLGFSFSGYYHLNKYWSVGVLYQPQLIRFDDGTHFNYSHSFSVEVVFGGR
jgi:hypothetical protein